MILSPYKNLLFDFDGVILDSLKVKDEGFRQIAHKIAPHKTEEFLSYHKINGGMSRFVKFRYLYEQLLQQPVTEETIQALSNEFSILMVKELTNPAFLIAETVDYIKANFKSKNLHIVSGTEQNELRFLCKELGVADYFKTIEGSPTHKNDLVKGILEKYGYRLEETVVIGDSINDYEAAVQNGIGFVGYNNESLIGKGTYLQQFQVERA